MDVLMRLFSIFGVIGYSCGFNIDFEYTVLKTGAADSFFGFSVAEYQEGDNHWLLVGAPKANSSFYTGANQEFSGAVFRCDAQSISKQCTELKFPFISDPSQESVSNQFFGVSLKTGGKNKPILSCANRFEYYGSDGKHRLHEGRCWVLSNTFVPENLFGPCRAQNSGGGKLTNYVNYGQCEAGVSVDILPENKDGFISFMMGAPGSRTFSGRIFDRDDDDTLLESSFGTDDETIYSNSYFGYSVTHGNFFDENEIIIATGGPRYLSYGKVLLYKRGSMTNYIQGLPGETDEIQIASGYGIALCTIDVNNDGLDELIVSAPFHSMESSRPDQGLVYVYTKTAGKDKLTLKRKLDASKFGTNNGVGANFGYAVANAGDLNLDGYKDLIIGAPHDNVGIGALYLYQGSKDGLTEEPTQIIKASEIHSGLTDNIGLKGFGRSFGVGMDLDANGYNDVLVGAYTSDQAILLRSRPVINVQASISFNPEELNVTQKNCIVRGRQTTCFNMIFCFNFTEPSSKIYTKQSDVIAIKYIIKADPIKESRVRFSSGLVTHETVGDTSRISRCITLQNLYLIYNNDGSIAVYPDVKFEIAYSLPYGAKDFPKPTRSDTQVVNLNSYPTLKQKFQDGVKLTHLHQLDYKLSFKRECTLCIPDLQITTKLNYTMGLGQEKFTFNITIRNVGRDPAYSVDLKFNFTEDLLLEGLKIEQKNFDCELGLCENVFNKLSQNEEVVVDVILNTKKFKPESDNVIEITILSANEEDNGTLDDNSLSVTLQLKVEADLELLQGKSTQQVVYSGGVKGESSITNLNEIGDIVDHKFVIRNNGPDLLSAGRLYIWWPYETRSGKHLLYLIDAVGSKKSTVCQNSQMNRLKLSGKSATPSRFQIEKSDANTRRRRSVDNNTAIDNTPQPTTVTVSDRSSTGNDSSVTASPGGGQTTPKKKERRKEGIVLDCWDTAYCTEIVCEFENLESGNTEAITVRSRLWQSSILIDYYGDVLTIVSKAKVESGNNMTYIIDTNLGNNKNELYTNVNPDFTAKKKEKKLWVYIIAALAGVILLAILIFGLYKLGFFKRNRYDSKYGVQDKKGDSKKLLNR